MNWYKNHRVSIKLVFDMISLFKLGAHKLKGIFFIRLPSALTDDSPPIITNAHNML